MTEPSSWGTLAKWATTLLKRWLPDRLLRWRWSNERLLQAIDVFHFDQAPRFYVRAERALPEIQATGFNVFNFSPFKFTIVGAELEMVIDSTTWFIYKQRLPSEISVDAYARGGFHFSPTLNDGHVNKLRTCPNDWVSIRIRGIMIIRTTFGELRKTVQADIVALIDRDAVNR